MVKKTRNRNINFEIEFYEGVLNKTPDFFEALCALGDLYTKKGHYQKGLQIDKRLVRIRPNDPVVLYNLACSYSLLNDVDQAFDNLQRAITLGYDDLYHLEHDDDLNNLRKNDKFRQYLDGLKKEHKQRQFD
ncbi:MAG: hypothetical protein H6755_02205 [Candidatus Omnitrophica bacterium]|nr:hypothetical protein [Candidatus Omnitrophota bacterium]